MDRPVVTVSVLNYHRREALERVLDSIRVQDHPAFETIVVDNGSGAETTDWIRRNYPWVRLVSLEQNRGTAARNHGLKEDRGEFVVTLDNDVYFDSPLDLRRVEAAFRRLPRAGCLAFRVYHPATGRLHARDWCHPRPYQEAEETEFATYFITEGASAFRREVFDRIQPYWEELWIGHEGFDLAMRLMDSGYEIWYTPDVKVWHLADLETRENWRPYYFNTRNLFYVVGRNYPCGAGFLHIVPRVAVLGFYAARYGFFTKFLSGVRDGFKALPWVWKIRRPVHRRVLRDIDRMRAGLPSLTRRFMRHWRKAEL